MAEEVGASVAPSLKDLTAGSDIILTVVTDDRAMDAVFFGEDNLFENTAGKVIVNYATVLPDVHRKIYAGAQSRGASSLEACMA